MKVKNVLVAMVFSVTVLGGYQAYENVSIISAESFLLANVEALTVGEGVEVVKCYCKANWFSPNVCTANGSGAYCGGDPCSNHDGNCRS